MTAEVSGSRASAPAALYSGPARAVIGVLGGAAVVLGLVLTFDVVAATRTLALVVGLALVANGCLEIAVSWGAGQRAGGVVLGGVLVVGGLVAVSWPGATVWVLAVLTGVSLLVHGIGRIAVAIGDRAEIPGWGWLALAGAFDVVVGVLALSWPEATVRVLCVLLGAEIVVFGALLLIWAFVGTNARTLGPQRA
jgi:uncharacterized membrane protein HdeD (DUF308 family)